MTLLAARLRAKAEALMDADSPTLSDNSLQEVSFLFWAEPDLIGTITSLIVLEKIVFEAKVDRNFKPLLHSFETCQENGAV
eukprot:5245757-Amphidinium_carterae.1